MSPPSSPLLTDLYQLTMLQAYLDEGMDDTAVFEFFVRRLPPRRISWWPPGWSRRSSSWSICASRRAELDWLARSGRFSTRLHRLAQTLRFTGDVHALPEGTVFFADEPILRITAPSPQAQLVETRLINLAALPDADRLQGGAHACWPRPGKLLVDFGLRRAHGAEAGAAGGARRLPRRLCRHRDGARRDAVRHPGLRHHGPLLHPGPRRRSGGLRALRPFAPRQPRCC